MPGEKKDELDLQRQELLNDGRHWCVWHYKVWRSLRGQRNGLLGSCPDIFFHSKGIHVTLDCVLKKKAAQVRITCSQEYDYVDFSLDMSDDHQTPMVLSKTYFVKPNGRSIFLLVKLHTSSSWFSRKTKNKYKKPTLFLSALFKILWRTSDKVSCESFWKINPPGLKIKTNLASSFSG